MHLLRTITKINFNKLIYFFELKKSMNFFKPLILIEYLIIQIRVRNNHTKILQKHIKIN